MFLSVNVKLEKIQLKFVLFTLLFANRTTSSRQLFCFVITRLFFICILFCNVFQDYLRDGAESTSAKNNFCHLPYHWQSCGKLFMNRVILSLIVSAVAYSLNGIFLFKFLYLHKLNSNNIRMRLQILPGMISMIFFLVKFQQYFAFCKNIVWFN
jgi:hypothetical protein